MPEYMPYMQMTGPQNQYSPMMGPQNQYSPAMEMPDEKMEKMYPKTYNMISPHVKNQADQFDNKYGMMQTPTKEQLEGMVNEVNKKVGPEVEAEIEKEDGQRQFGHGGRRVLRDLISILLIQQLLERRRHHFHGGFPSGGFGGYPWGYGYGGFPRGYDDYYGYYGYY